MSEERDEFRPGMTVTPEAMATVLEARSNETDSESLALWIEVNGVHGGAYTYDVYFRVVADASPMDVVQYHDDLPVVLPSGSVDCLRGSVLELVITDDDKRGLVVINPNTVITPVQTSQLPVTTLDYSDPITQRVVTVLEEQVNPSIGVHGGRAHLVAIEDLAVYIRLSGGCQGCGMAKATLSEGIEVMLRGAIPELTSIIDVTDHADGTNPFYESVPS